MGGSKGKGDGKRAGHLQFSLFSTPLGEFAKEGVLLCISRETATLKDFPLLQGILRDVREHCERHGFENSDADGLADLDALIGSADLISELIDKFDERRLDRDSIRNNRPSLARDELETLFALRSVLRDRIIGTYKAKSK